MTINEFKIFLNNAFISIAEYMEKLILTFFGQTSKDYIQLGDIIFLIITGFVILSLVLSALSKINFYKNDGLESYYLDQIAIQSKKDDRDSSKKS